MSSTPVLTITATAHPDCEACDMSAEGARYYVEHGGRITNGKAGNGQLEGGPHWATFTTDPDWLRTAYQRLHLDEIPRIGVGPARSIVGRVAAIESVDDVVEVDEDHEAPLRELLLDAVGQVVDRLDLARRLAADYELHIGRGEDHAGDTAVTVAAVLDGDADSRVLAEKLGQALVERQRDRRECLPIQVVREVANREGRLHGAAPSAGEGAEPGQASTASVGGEPAAGGPNAWTPAASKVMSRRALAEARFLDAALAEAQARYLDAALAEHDPTQS